MKIFQNLIAILMLIACSSGCKKEIHDKQPLVGKVLLINSNTPVDRALVRFVKQLPSSWLGPISTRVTYETITNERGEFIIPDSTSADYIQAWGVESIYGSEPSQAVYLASFLANNSSQLKVYIKPPAWIKVHAIDIPPLNPEVLAIYLDSLGSGDLHWTQSVINSAEKWKITGNTEYTLRGKKAIENVGQVHFNIPLPNIVAFDTLHYTLEY
jgi:hypothetical protein